MAENQNQSQMRKGMLDYCILLIINKQRSYASDILSALKDADLIVVEGTLYPLLTRLKNSGLLTYAWQESTQGPPRKYYEITDEGKATLQSLNESWNELQNAITKLQNQN